MQIVSVAVGWQLWQETRNALYLGLIGLVQFLPALISLALRGRFIRLPHRPWS